jgi:cyclic-di-GMP-binding biofilm dispersal mediator protein
MKIVSSRALVIGASGSLGSLLASDLLRSGAEVSLISRSGRLDDSLRDAPHANADLRDLDSVTSALDALSPPFDIVVNAAGVVAFGRVDELPADVARELFEVNALGVLHLLHELPSRLSEGGVLVNLTGVAADVTVLGLSAYSASKAAAKSALAVAAREWRSQKIRVLDVRAPHTETGLVTRALWGSAPNFGVGLAPDLVSDRIRRAIEQDETLLTPDSFTTP